MTDGNSRFETGQTRAPAAHESAAALLAYALALELEASERYADLADQMTTHNNPEVAGIFERLSRIEKLHADQVREKAANVDLPEIGASAYRWETPEGPETTDFSDVHYLMSAHQALQLALHNECRARDFFARIAAEATDQDVVDLAAEMVEEEKEHVALMEEWLAKYPPSDEAFTDDPDPPVDQG